PASTRTSSTRCRRPTSSGSTTTSVWSSSRTRRTKPTNRTTRHGTAGSFNIPTGGKACRSCPTRPLRSSTTATRCAPRRERSQVVERAEAHDVSPHLEGRAQPGDVLGIETGGEETHIGDSKEDED